MARKTLAERRSEKLEELERIKSDLVRLVSQAAERIGKIAIRAGLGDIDVADDQLLKEFTALAVKFQTKVGKKDKPASPGEGTTDEN